MKKILTRLNKVTEPTFLAKSHPDVGQATALFGLPLEVKFCTSCVISNQRPSSAVEFRHNKNSKKKTISFDEESVCAACKHNELKAKVDWTARSLELQDLCDRYRKDGQGYDCLVPGSGGKDSVYASHLLKSKYGMNPLTVTWAPNLYTDWGWANFQGWINSGFDNYLVTPNPKTHRLLTRLAVENLFHPFQPFMIGQKLLAPKVAALMDIQLVFYGENEAEYGNPVGQVKGDKREDKFFTTEHNHIHLGGVAIEELQSEYGLQTVDLHHYLPIKDETIVTKGIEVHYLGHYERWHPQGAYYFAVENSGFQPSPERTVGTYSKYNSIDDKIDDFHYYTTFIKFGIGRATYDAAQEIRNDEITRDEGVALVEKYDGEYPLRFEDDVFKYLSITETEYPQAYKYFDQQRLDRDYFASLTDSFRSPHLWQFSNGKWKLRTSVWD